MQNPYDILFEPVKIGPVTAKNRFYQVPHCCGMGHLRPQAHAAMRGIKAEGGWAVVSTEETEIHPSSDLSPYAEQRLWDHRDIPALQLMTEAVHKHGALAAIELAHNGYHSPNLFSRTPPLAPVSMAQHAVNTLQARPMNKRDIRELRRWHKQAALNAQKAGFDIIYVYAGHGMTLTQQFMLPEFNTRSDEYGGSLENRIRLTRELLEETKEAVGDSCAVAFRFAVDELKGNDGMQAQEEGRAVVEMLAELPDLWDVNVSDWSNDSQTTRFAQEEGYQTPYIEFVKQVTTKPVVAVGRLNSPDTMVSMVKRGIVDLIGAARPSIADPYLPNKIRDNRIDEIRECIGCNICVSADNLGVPIRCTQNPTMGEEWRRGWHPERHTPKKTDAQALVVGAGPAGLECSLHLARRGYEVILSEADTKLGGRVRGESGLKGLSAWGRVADYRTYALQQMANVSIYTDSEVTTDMVQELAIDNIFLATGSHWRADGVGRSNRYPLTGLNASHNITVLTPDQVMAGQSIPTGPIVIYDDDQAYIAGVIADQLSSAGHEVIFVTPASVVSPWTDHTLEQERIQSTLLQQNVQIITGKTLSAVNAGQVEIRCHYTGRTSVIDCTTLVLVTERVPNTTLHDELCQLRETDENCVNWHIELVGDALSPGLIADAVFQGHLIAENFQADPVVVEQALFRREIPSLVHE
ncbi:MAG: FAD-dependent oxidoreductase [Thiolinea sp.]